MPLFATGSACSIAVAFAGLAFIAMTIGSDLNGVGLSLAVAAAFSWAVGNVLVKRALKVPMFPLVIWCSLVRFVPADVAQFEDAGAAPVG